MEQNDLSVERVLGAVLRRKGAFLASFVAMATAFGGAASKIPPKYKASVILTIEPGKFPNDFLRPNVIPGLDTRLAGLEKMLQSAPVIEELRTRTGLAARDSARGGLTDTLGLASDPIDSWRKNFMFEILPGEAQGRAKVDEAAVIEMSFKYSDPELAAKVVNAAAARANEENTRFRRAFVEEVVRFVQKEAERATQVAHEREDAFNSFKLANTDRLPEQEPYIVARLGQLRMRYADLRQSERFADARMEQLTAERGLLVAQIALNVQIAGAGTPGDTRTPLDLRQERMRLMVERDAREDEYKRLLTEFTEKCPQVIIAKDRLESTKTRLADVELKLTGMGTSLNDVPDEAPRHKDPLDELDGTMPGGLRKVPVKLPGQSKLEGDDSKKSGDKGKDPKDAPRDSKDKKDPKEPKDSSKKAKDPSKKESSRDARAKKDMSDSDALPESSANRVVQLLSNTPLDEKTLEKQLDRFAYRIVVENPGYARIRGIDFALKETKASIEETAKSREESFSEIRKAEEQLAAIPEVRQRLEALGRGLAEAREDWARLTNQLDNARKALEVESEGKGEQLRVIDFARPPTKPTGPGPVVFIGIAIAAALGAAAGLCLLFDLRAAKKVAPVKPAAPAAPAPPAPPSA